MLEKQDNPMPAPKPRAEPPRDGKTIAPAPADKPAEDREFVARPLPKRSSPAG